MSELTPAWLGTFLTGAVVVASAIFFVLMLVEVKKRWPRSIENIVTAVAIIGVVLLVLLFVYFVGYVWEMKFGKVA